MKDDPLAERHSPRSWWWVLGVALLGGVALAVIAVTVHGIVEVFKPGGSKMTAREIAGFGAALGLFFGFIAAVQMRND